MINMRSRSALCASNLRHYTGAAVNCRLRFTVPAAAVVGLLAVLPAAAQQPAAGSHAVSVGLGQMRVAIPPVSTSGVLVPVAGAPRANLTAPEKIDLIGGGLVYRYTSRTGLPTWLDPAGRTSGLTYRLAWARFSGDATAAAEVPQGGIDVGLVPIKSGAPPAPQGFSTGPAGLASRARLRVDNGRLEMGASWAQNAAWLPAATVLQPSLRLGWTQLDYFVLSNDRFLDAMLPADEFGDERDQRLQHDIFDFTVGARLERYWGPANAVSVFADIGASLYFLKATLVAYEFITVNGARRRRFAGGGAREFSVGGELTLGATWQASAHWHAQVALQHRPWVPTGSINNPTTAGAGARPAFLGTAREPQTTGLLSLTYRFGAG